MSTNCTFALFWPGGYFWGLNFVDHMSMNQVQRYMSALKNPCDGTKKACRKRIGVYALQAVKQLCHPHNERKYPCQNVGKNT